MRYRRGENPRSLANLRHVKPGQVLNPEGRNQATRQREGWEIAVALARAVEAERDDERRVELLEDMARHALDAGIAGDPYVMRYLLQMIWPVE